MNEKKCKLHDQNTLIIKIDENIYQKEIKGSDKLNRTITLMNNGNLPMTVKNITIDNNNECQTSNMRIVQCKEFILNPQETINIDIEIIPNYRYNSSNKIISFNTEFQSFYLNVYIIFSKDFFESQNHIRIFLKCLLIVTPIVSVMLYSLSKIINVFKKQRREMCGDNSSKEENENEKDEKNEILLDNAVVINKLKHNENDQLEYNIANNNSNFQQNKNKQKQGKKKKNRRKSFSSNNQKDETDAINNNNYIKEKIENEAKLDNVGDNKNIILNNKLKEENKNENKNDNKTITQVRKDENENNKLNNNDNENESNKKVINDEGDLKSKESDNKKIL